MTISIHTARYYLERWGAYMRADRNAGLGVPSIAVFYKEAIGSPAGISDSEPEGVQIMQKIYLKLLDEHKRVIDMRYKYGLSIRKAANELNISYRKFRESIIEAENIVKLELNNYPA